MLLLSPSLIPHPYSNALTHPHSWCAVRLLEAAPSAAFYACDLLKAHSAQSAKHRQVGGGWRVWGSG